MKKICVVTGSRAEYGLMSRLMHLIDAETSWQLQIIATNTHLSPEFGLTYREIEADGFTIDRKVEMLLSSDTANGTAKSTGLGMIGLADAYESLQPDLIVLLGDRYEMLAAASAALLYKIPVAHISGGDVTEGAFDDAIRHSITKMSHLHFSSTETYRNRIIQLGENPSTVFNVGALGVDNIRHLPLLGKEKLENTLAFSLDCPTLLVTFHPETLESHPATEQMQELLRALDAFPQTKILFTHPNSDTQGREIISLITEYVSAHPQRCTAYPSLGHLRYLSCLQYVSAVVGNSSSGVLEVPSFGIPTVNIGNRQKGRLKASSVIDCECSKEAIEAAIKTAFSDEMAQTAASTTNPYEQSDTARRIVEILKQQGDFRRLIPKSFYDLKQL